MGEKFGMIAKSNDERKTARITAFKDGTIVEYNKTAPENKLERRRPNTDGQ